MTGQCQLQTDKKTVYEASAEGEEKMSGEGSESKKTGIQKHWQKIYREPGGCGPEWNIENTGGGEAVGDSAAEQEARTQSAVVKRKKYEKLREAELDRAVGERCEAHCQGRVDCGENSIDGEKFCFHDLSALVFF